ncbi:hypothetical protein [Candidatus Albibeggiatoa sp. nov. BB20]|uniref:hypothetical protein n=1 Tax=Candidatus Albibeggiatoa sp. nov. BB20 TaxID=3162723 RepID=UPI003365A609
MNKLLRLIWIICLLLQVQAVGAIPEPLQAWTDWVLHDTPDRKCPFIYNSNERLCYWASELHLKINDNKATWQQEWRVYGEGWIPLVGSRKHFPQNVTLQVPNILDTSSLPVIISEHDQIPSAFLQAGHYILSGEFNWQRQPEYLQVPSATGLVSLEINDKAVEHPTLDNAGRLWLRQRGVANEEPTKDNRLDIRVYRHVIDEIPLQIETRIELDVAGKHREEILAPALLAEQIPMGLDSPLPARLEANGQLKVQVRPGSWVIMLTTRYAKAVNEIQLPQPELWANEEVWVFEGKNHLRWVEVQNVDTIDPRQTALPSEWQQFPAYRMLPNDAMQLVEKRRGDPEPAPDQLRLRRQFWLDFDGIGYSVQDRIEGTMTRGWRLEMAEPAHLGRASVNGQNQFITRLQDSSHAGVEVRRGNINLVADSRLEGTMDSLPTVGWLHDFQQVNAVLHLPPGWRILNASGVDSIHQTWVNQWTLLDIFIVLIIAIAVAKLWRWYWGVLMLVTLVLIYHEPDAPRYVWLNILVAVALLRVLPAMSMWAKLAGWYRNITVLALLLITVPFMAQQIRQSIFPQLEHNLRLGQSVAQTTETFATAKPAAPQAMYEENNIMADEAAEMHSKRSSRPNLEQKYSYGGYNKNMSPRKQAKKLVQIDPNAQVQTGPGLPHWQWQTVEMGWNGPVQQQQNIKLWLISPQINRVLGFSRVLLLSVLIGLLMLSLWKRYQKHHEQLSFKLDSFAWLAMGIWLAMLPISQPLQAATTDYPPKYLLNELKDRLLEPPECLPSCATSPRMSLELNDNQLSLRLEVHTYTATAIPLPGTANQWLAQQVFVNGEKAEALMRDERGQLWVKLDKGIHQVQLNGVVPSRNTVQLPLPLKPHWIEAKASGWLVEGLHENGLADNQLQFTREQSEDESTRTEELEMGSLPPFVRIQRTLSLGLDWQVETVVTRLTPTGSAVVLEIPLLQGESVTSEKIRVQDGKALINLSPHERAIRWVSVFDELSVLELIAPDSLSSTEVWKLDVSAIWHVEIDGIPVIHHQDKQGNWLPEWRPWAGERVLLNISRPLGVTGQAMTIDRSHLLVKPGQRSTESTLSLSLRSSRGSQHSLTLPEDAELQSVKINNTSQPIRQEDRQVTLPVKPGQQNIELVFRQPIGMDRIFTTPTVGLGMVSVNTDIELSMPYNRWTLWTDTSLMGPAVLIWGLFIMVVLLAAGLHFVQLTPLNFVHWLLLGIVLIQIPIQMAALVVAWFIMLGWRKNINVEFIPAWRFDLLQFSIFALTGFALIALFAAIHQGLLGQPNMYITGNDSTPYIFRWYHDRIGEQLPQVWVLSLSLWVYRIAMLLWALWLSFALLRWLRWGWECFTANGFWKDLSLPWQKKVVTK